MPSRSRVAGANRSVAPQNGGSSRMLNRTATKFVPPMRTTAAKASGIKRLGDRLIMPASRFLRLGFQALLAWLPVIHGPQTVSRGAPHSSRCGRGFHTVAMNSAPQTAQSKSGGRRFFSEEGGAEVATRQDRIHLH